ncbi:MAG TPA: aldo/keto reductase [Candidatus Desulfaltia sp.]|nr:aldo/keto reductase [Candidatus Desulfaltia sp.]
MKKKLEIGRRDFIKSAAIGIAGAAVPAGAARLDSMARPIRSQEPSPPKIKEYRVLGRTGFKVSDLATGYIQDFGVFSTMLDAGVNYIDTGESYPGSHKLIGRVLEGRDRKKIFLTSKMLLEDDITREGFLKRARKCLEDLQTDYFDCMMLHMPERVEVLKTEGFHAAMEELKAEGRIRFVGVSHHGSFWFRNPEESMEKVLLAAVEDGRFDVFLMAYNFLQMDKGERVIQAAKEKKIGITLMKTKPVGTYAVLKSRIEQLEKEGKEVDPLYREGLARYKDIAERAETFIQKYNLRNPEEIKEAALRFALSNPDIHTVCCSAKTYAEAEQFLRQSGSRLSAQDALTLARYGEACGRLYCRHACGLCEPECPRGVPVNTIMRYHHYFAAQGREKEAMLKYAHIPGARAEDCGHCSGHCEMACPYDVPIQGMLLLAHHQLTLA